MPVLEVIEQTQTPVADGGTFEARLALLMFANQTESEDVPNQKRSENSPCQNGKDHYPSPKESEDFLSQKKTGDCPSLAENENSPDLERGSSPVHSETGGDGTSSRRRKSTPHDDGRENKRHKSGKKEIKKERKSRRKKKRANRKDPLFDHDPKMVQGPTHRDFSTSNYSTLHSSQYTPARITEPKTFDDDEDDEDFVAPPPGIPDAHDDTREARLPPEQDCEPSSPESSTPEPRTRRPRVRKPRRAPDPPLPGFLRLPLEIRDKVYREILVVKFPILVRDGWRRIYARKRPGIDTAILRTSRQLYRETVRVLYGENTFLYRLRDAPSQCPVVNVEELSLNDAKDDDAEVLMHGFTDDDVAGRNDKIDIAKFGSYFRRLTVEAERNRYSEETQQAMAQAIQVFTTQPDGSTKACAGGVKMNIHTFTIRIHPQYQPGTFTFLDFFHKTSPVMEAISSLSSQFVKIDVVTKYLNGGQEPGVSRLTIDTRYLNLSLYAARQRTGSGRGSWRADLWRNSKLMGWQREEGKKRSLEALEKLDNHILEACERHVVDDVIQMSWDGLGDEEYDVFMAAEGEYEELVLGTAA
ncbi:hypothetical protein QQZ08_005580 [Neonectria magnoliae]|uniref:Uncharacterized protein n=1 Tax=Neonectria magnoliae TaxID=2732573 RepID=A0ABR1I502_9HYPO